MVHLLTWFYLFYLFTFVPFSPFHVTLVTSFIEQLFLIIFFPIYPLPLYTSPYPYPYRCFLCSGTKHLRAIMSINQCDIFHGRRQADYLTGLPISFGRDVVVHTLVECGQEFTLLLSGYGPCSIGKSGEVWSIRRPSRLNMFHDSDFECFSSTSVADKKQDHFVFQPYAVRC